MSRVREARALINATAPSPESLSKAREVLELALDAEPLPTSPLVRLTVEHAMAAVDAGTYQLADMERVCRVALVDPEGTLWLVRRLLNRLLDCGTTEDATQLASVLFCRTHMIAYGSILHRFQLDAGSGDAAAKTADRLADRLGPDHELPHLLRADGLFATGSLKAATHELERVKPSFSARYSRRLVRSLRARGDQRAILTFLDNYSTGLTDVDERVWRFDAHFALGNRSEAELQLEGIPSRCMDERGLSRVAKAFGVEAGQSILQDLIEEIDTEATGTTADLERRGITLFRANRPHEAVLTLRRAEAEGELEPPGCLTLAQALYSIRDFEAALEQTESLMRTRRQAQGMRLRARALIQLGRIDEALENRLEYQRAGDGFDPIRYAALLLSSRYEEAFRLQPGSDEFRDLRAVFGTRAERHPVEHVDRRFVVADAGPGDEIQDASLFGELSGHSEHLAATCDPRLESLFNRSFPGMEFIPVERLRNPPHFASHGPDAVQRAGNALDALLTRDAETVAKTFDRVVLGRATKTIRDLSGGPKPAEPFILPDSTRSVWWRNHLAGQRPTIGLVWRSELRSSWRGIHYVDVEQLDTLAALDASFLCLQHDVTVREREALQAALPGKVRFEDHVDLRNDFEETAALLSALDLTIGVGTTMSNLAASVGCRTVMMQPTMFGRWLATGQTGQDFWYEPCSVVTVMQPPFVATMFMAAVLERAQESLKAI